LNCIRLEREAADLRTGWNTCVRFSRAQHQQCLAPLLRRCDELLETASGGAVRRWQAEHGIRFSVIPRKIWRGNRTWVGARTRAVLVSVWRTP
jgi:hypothetical protein